MGLYESKIMEDNLENRILEKKVSFSVKDIKWVVTSAVVLVLWIVTAILWVKDKDTQSEKISNLEKQNSTLEKQVATLEGQIRGVENVSKIFMENPPSENRFRIEQIEKRVDRLELPGSNPPAINVLVNDTTNVIRRTH